MYKPVLLFLLLLSAFNANAQNYSCFQPDTIQYYTNHDGYVRGIRIDSVYTAGTDVIYYPFKTPRGYYDFNTTQLDSNGGSWVGGKVIAQNNGNYLFDNFWGDTAIIKTQAALGDQWTFYQHLLSPYSYRAQVTGIDTMSFLGYTDSVKKIKISAYNGVNLNPSDSMHNFEIILSKSHGFVQTFDIYMFPYHPHDSAYQIGRDYYMDELSASPPGKHNGIFRIADYNYVSHTNQYEWNVGDVYQYSQCNFTCNGIYSTPYTYVDTIEQISYSGDTANYISSGWKRQVFYFPNNYHSYTFHQNVPMQSEGFVSPIHTSYMPEEKHQEYRPYFYPDDTGYCMNTPRYRFKENKIDHQMQLVLFESGYYHADYKAGLGLVYYYIFHGGGGTEESERKLTYYDRNGFTCGNFSPVSIEDIALPESDISIYPNPVSDELTIDVSLNAYNISLVNTLGQIVYTKQECSRKTIVNTSSLPSGIYYLKLTAEGQPIDNNKILIQR